MAVNASGTEKKYILDTLRKRLDNLGVSVDVVGNPEQAGTFGPTGKGQYQLRFTNTKSPSNPDTTYEATVSLLSFDSAFNEDSVLVIQNKGAGGTLVRGVAELNKDGPANAVSPFINGLEAFSKYIAAAYTNFNEQKSADASYKGAVSTEVSALLSKGGSGEQQNLPINMTYIPEQVSSEELRKFIGQKMVSFSPGVYSREDKQTAKDNFLAQISGSVVHGTDRYARLSGGGFLKDNDKLVYEQPSALGTMYQAENGEWHMATLGNKEEGKSYISDKRNQARGFVHTADGNYIPLERSNVPVQQQGVVRFAGDIGSTLPNIKIRSALPMGGLPLQGGFGNFRYPQAVLNALGNSTLEYGFESNRSEEIADVSKLGDLYEADGKTLRFKLSLPTITDKDGNPQVAFGKTVRANGAVRLGSYKGQDGEEKGINISVGQRGATVEGMYVNLPVNLAPVNEQDLLEEMERRGASKKQIEKAITENNRRREDVRTLKRDLFKQSGMTAKEFRQIEFGYGYSGKLQVGTKIVQFGPHADKEKGRKQAVSGLNFIMNENDPASVRRYENAMTIHQLDANGNLYVPNNAVTYNQLTEGKSNAAALHGAMEAMSSDQLYRFMQMAYGENGGTGGVTSEAMAKLKDQLGGGKAVLEDVAQTLGFKSYELMNDDLWNRVIRPEVPLTDPAEAARQRENIDQFGIGRQSGWLPLSQFDTDELARFKREGLEGMISNNVISPDASREDQEAAYQRVFDTMYKLGPSEKIDGRVVRQMFMRGPETLIADELHQPVQEYAGGVESVDEQFLMGLRTGGLSAAEKWIKENQLRGNSPSQTALREMSSVRSIADAQQRGYDLGNLEGAAITLDQEVGGKTTTAQELLDILGEQDTQNPIGKMEEFAKKWDEVVADRTKSNKQSWLMRGKNTGLVLPSPRSLMATDYDGLTVENTPNGGLSSRTLAHMSDRGIKLYRDVLRQEALAESGGQVDQKAVERARTNLLKLTSKSTNGKELNQYEVRQGFSGRYAVSPLVPMGKVFMPNSELNRIAEIFNLGTGKATELAKRLSGKLAMYMRDPTPTVGTDEHAGSILPMEIMTSASREGKALQGEVDRNKMVGASMIIGQAYSSTQGDGDFDPYRMIPLFMLGMGKNGDITVRSFGQKGDEKIGYEELLKAHARSYTYEAQTRLFKEAGLEADLNPTQSPQVAQLLTGLQLLEDSGEVTGLRDIAALNKSGRTRWVSEKDMKTASGVMAQYDTELREKLANETANKLEFMGSHYNTFKRNLFTQFASLGLSEKQAVTASDYHAAYYQHALDKKGKKSPLGEMINTFSIKHNDDGSWSTSVGLYTPDGQKKPDFANLNWDPTKNQETNFKHALGLMAGYAMSGKNDTTPEAGARLVAAAGATGTQEERDAVYLENVSAITKELQGTRDQNDVKRVARKMVDEGRISENSPFFRMVWSAGVSRMERADRGSKIIPSADIDAEQWNIGDTHYASGVEMRDDVNMSQTVLEMLKNSSNTQRTPQGYDDKEHITASYQRPEVLARVLKQAAARGVSDQPLFRAVAAKAATFGISETGESSITAPAPTPAPASPPPPTPPPPTTNAPAPAEGGPTGGGFSLFGNMNREDQGRVVNSLQSVIKGAITSGMSQSKIQMIWGGSKKLSMAQMDLIGQELFSQVTEGGEDAAWMSQNLGAVVERVTGRTGGFGELFSAAGGDPKVVKRMLKNENEFVFRLNRMANANANAKTVLENSTIMVPAIEDLAAKISGGNAQTQRIAQDAIMSDVQIASGNPSVEPNEPAAVTAQKKERANMYEYAAAAKAMKIVGDAGSDSVPTSPRDWNRMEALAKQMDIFKESSEKLGEAMKGGSERAEALAAQELKLSEVRTKRQKSLNAASEIAERVGALEMTSDGTDIDYEGTRKKLSAWRSAKRTEFSAKSARGEEIDPVESAEYTQASDVLDDLSRNDNELVSAGREKRVAQNSYGLGGFARKIFGGFGLMYMRSVGNLMLSSAKLGYGESIQQRAEIDKSLGAALGGISYSDNPEQRFERIMASYGGGGMRALRTIQGDLAQNAPGVYKGLNSVISGVSAFGAGSWMLPQIFPALAGSAALTPALGVAGAAVALGSYALSQYGEYKDLDTSAAEIGRLSIDPSRRFEKNLNAAIHNKRMEENGRGTRALDFLDGYKAHSYAEDETFYAGTRAGQVFIGRDIDSVVNGLSPERMATTAKATAKMFQDAFPNISSQGLNAANSLMFSTGTNFGRQFSTIATMIGQGVPIENVTGTMLTNMGMSANEIHTNFGGGSAYGNTILALSGTNLSQASSNVIMAGEGLRSQFGANINYWNKPENVDKASILARLEEDKKYGAIANTPLQDLVIAEEVRASKAKELGISNYGKNDILNKYVHGNQQGNSLYGVPYQYAYSTDNISEREYKEMQLASTQWDQYIGRMDQYQTSLSSMGFSLSTINGLAGKFNGPEDMGALEFAIQKADLASQYGNYAAYSGSSYGTKLANKEKIANMGARQMQLFQGVMNLDPKSIAMSFAGVDSSMLMTEQFDNKSGGMSSIYDLSFGAGFDQTGTQLTGLQWGKGSFARMGRSAQDVAVDIWGRNWNSGAARGYLNAGVNGFTYNGKTYYGEHAMGFYGNQRQYDHAMASIGNQMANWNLQYAFTTGVGLNAYAGTVNPQTGSPFNFNTGNWSWNVGGVGSGSSVGGGTWGLEDVMRQMGNAQQEWNFGQQQRQMTMQNNQFYENLSLNRTQSMMQRGWTQDDWAYQDQTRTMQWGWKQEDFNEEVRFMTGRQRRLAERSMKRETISHNMEGDQIDKTRDRQKELWELEDQRFTVQKRQHEEQLQMQKEQLQVQKNMFEERKRLEEEQVKLQRAMWVNQMELQKQAMGISAAAAAEQKDYNDKMLEYQIYQENATTKLDIFIEALAKLLDLDLSGLDGHVGGGGAGGGAGGVGGGNKEHPTANGGSMIPGERYMINEHPGTGPEVIVSSRRGYILTKQDAQRALAAAKMEQDGSTIVPSADQWQNSILPSSRRNENTQMGPQTIIVKIGEETIKTFIVDTVNSEVRL